MKYGLVIYNQYGELDKLLVYDSLSRLYDCLDDLKVHCFDLKYDIIFSECLPSLASWRI